MKLYIVRHLTKIVRFLGKNIGFLLLRSPIGKKRRIAEKFQAFILGLSPRLDVLTFPLAISFFKKALDPNDPVYVQRSINDIVLDLDISKTTQREIFFHRIYEPHIVNFLHSTIKEGDLFVDIGANVGYYSVQLASNVGPEGRIFSFEPENDNFKKLLHNIKINNINNIIAINKAVAAEPDQRLFISLNPLNEGGHSMARNFSDKKGRFQIVETESLDHFFSNFINHKNKLTIKIDVEGYELSVLEGAKTLMESKVISAIICEVTLETIEKVFIFCEAVGYNPHLINREGKITRLASRVFPKGKNDILFLPFD